MGVQWEVRGGQWEVIGGQWEVMVSAKAGVKIQLLDDSAYFKI